MNRSESFDKMAALYDKIRPAYPEQLIKDIISKTQLTSNARLLEIGAGTGKATVQFAEKGFTIDCIEMGENLAEVLKFNCKEYPNVKVDVSTFEEWEPEAYNIYDIVYCAQAFHWIDKDIKYIKAHSLLKDNGYLALFWYQNSDETSEVLNEINSMIKSYIPDFFDNEVEKGSYIESREMRRLEIIESRLFNNPEIIEYTVDSLLDVDTYIQSISTYSRFAVLTNELQTKISEEIRRIITNNGGYVKSIIAYTLYLAKKA